MSRRAGSGKGRSVVLEDVAAIARQALELVRIADRWAARGGAEYHLRSVAVYPPSQSRNGMWLVVGKGWAGGYKVVAFHRAPDLLTALVGFFAKAEQGKLEWQPDKYDTEG